MLEVIRRSRGRSRSRRVVTLTLWGCGQAHHRTSLANTTLLILELLLRITLAAMLSALLSPLLSLMLSPLLAPSPMLVLRITWLDVGPFRVMAMAALPAIYFFHHHAFFDLHS